MKVQIKLDIKIITNKLQSLVNKPTVHQEMKSKPSKKSKKSSQEVDKKETKPKTTNCQKMQMEVLLMQQDSKEQNKSLLQNYDKEELEKSKVIESDMRSQSFSLEKRLARRRFSQNKNNVIYIIPNSWNFRNFWWF